jgi:hypothetical protein
MSAASFPARHRRAGSRAYARGAIALAPAGSSVTRPCPCDRLPSLALLGPSPRSPAGCGEREPPVSPSPTSAWTRATRLDVDDAAPDSGQDGSPTAPAGCRAPAAAQCDDGVDCTTDICADDGRCVNLPNATRVRRHGVLQRRRAPATRGAGASAGTPIACNDNYTCTIDRCDEETKTLRAQPRDFDRDGDPDIRCSGPTCGDAGVPPTRRDGLLARRRLRREQPPGESSLLPEICGDGIDNNCNTFVDMAEPGGCRRPPGDNCDDALDVSRGRALRGEPRRAPRATSPLRCAGNAMLQRDVVLRLAAHRAPRPRGHRPEPPPALALLYLQVQNSCGAATGTAVRECVLGFPSVYRTRALPAGEYFILLGATGSVATMADVEVNVDLSPPRCPPPTRPARPRRRLPRRGGTVRGSLVAVTDDVLTRCGGTNPDLVYRITLPETRDLSARLTGARNEFLQVSLLSNCMRSPTSLRCTNGRAGAVSRAQPRGGDVLHPRRGPAHRGGFHPGGDHRRAHHAPAGDTCAAPLALAAGQTVTGSFAEYEDDYQLSCAGSNSRDVVYRFTLTEPSDVTLIARGGLNAYYYLGLQRTCGERTGEVACRFGAPARLSARGLDPGTYFVVVKALQGGDFTLSLDARAPLSATMVTGNDTCSTPYAIPPGGGYFTGSTAMMRRDYQASCLTGMTSEDVVFRVAVDRRSRVYFSTEGSSFDTVMWLTTADMCPGRAIPQACNDDAIGTAAAFDAELEPGMYYLFLGGFSSSARGNYSLLVLPTALP